MHLSSLPWDILYNIANSLLNESHLDQPINWAFVERRRTLYPLIRVCRSFYAAFVPLLYHSLSTYIEFLEEDALQGDWTKYVVERRVRMTGSLQERDVWRALRARPWLCRWTKRLEIDWDGEAYRAGASEQVEQVLSSFVDLVELDIGANQPPSRLHWRLDFLCGPAVRNLTRLTLNCPFDPKLIPHIFFLPHIDELKLGGFDARAVVDWSLPANAVAGTSPVTVLDISAIISISQWKQILSWPQKLLRFKHDHSGFRNDEWEPISPDVIEESLRRFQHTLEILSLKITDDGQHHDKWFRERCKVQPSFSGPPTSRFSLRHFEKLSNLSICSIYLFVVPCYCPCSTRTNLLSRLPLNLKTLCVQFTYFDPILHCTLGDRAYSTFPFEAFRKWIQSEVKGSLVQRPSLRSIDLRDESGRRTDLGRKYYINDIWLNIYPTSAYVCCTPCAACRLRETQYREDENHYWADRADSQWSDERQLSYFGDHGPVFGTEETEYSDSRRGSEYEDMMLSLRLMKRDLNERKRWRNLERSWGTRPPKEIDNSTESTWDTWDCQWL